MKTILLAVCILVLGPGLLMADPVQGTPESGLDNNDQNEEPPGIMWNLQAGVFYRLGGERYREDSGSFMGTVDLSWLKWDRRHWTWGLGIHAAFSDDGGPRFAPKGLYRIPLKKPGSFFQASAGVYLAAIDQEMGNGGQNTTRLNLPGFFLEAEYGLNDHFSLVLGAEALPLDIYGEGEYNTDTGTPVDNMTITNLWLGAKGGQLTGLLIMLAVGVGVAIWAASY